MHIISKKALIDFWEKHKDSEDPLKTWFKIIKATRYAGYSDLRATFGSIDKVGDKIVFNIGGNKYRLIAVIHFNDGRVYVRRVMTHREYDKEEWENG